MRDAKAERIRGKAARQGVHRVWLAVSFVLAFLAIGSMHWMKPYAQVSLPNSLLGPGLGAVLIAGALACVAGRANFWIALLVVGSAAPAAIAARVVVDTARDPTSHNLWPFELVLGGIVGYAAAAVGALLAIGWKWVTGKK
ncbi:MAG TPA: hypothetical protein VFH88_14260 [Candidatus Krumholzibacteria bacterium]|nr:hypothetical protein [Candidatus Krumholzibacteria bacterium]